MNNLTSAAVATTLAEVLTLPICTVKTNYQNTTGVNVTQTIANVYRAHGLAGFIKASPPAVASQVLSTSSKYCLYRYFNNDSSLLSNKMACGAISGILSSLLTHPFDTVRVHVQMKDRLSLINLIKTESPLILYRGYSKSLAKVCVGSSLFFPLYDYIKSNLETNNPMIPAMLSAVLATTLVHPIDYLKTRQIYGLQLYQSRSFLFYYKGLSLNLCRVVPHFTIVMTIIELLK